jgi:hypothetical protein
VLAAAAGVYAADGPRLYSIGGVVMAIGLYGLDKAIGWFWHELTHRHA